jgi:phenylpyruvate tautomerase PptA (4-oxalocrotonate tautomerase family)
VPDSAPLAQDPAMPFLEVNDFPDLDVAAPACRADAARRMTQALADCWCIDPAIISCYFQLYPADAYAHAGEMPTAADTRRIFVKLHAIARTADQRRAAAAAVTRAAAKSYGVPERAIVIYFFERAVSEIAHGGVLEGGTGHINLIK